MLDPPGVFTYRDGVAVIQLVFFAAYLGFGFILCQRHGYRRAEGWVTLITFSLLRLIGASFQLASINYPTDSVYGGALICQEIGLAPLTLLNIGLFGRLNKWVDKLHRAVFSVVSLVTIAGLVLGIYGGIWSSESANLGTNALLKASVICFVACYVTFLVMFVFFWTQRPAIPRGEQTLLLCFAFSIPFMILRYLYSILPDFIENIRGTFNPLMGNVTAFLLMDVVEEIIVVGALVFTGIRLKKLPPELRAPPLGRKKKRSYRSVPRQ